MVASEPVLQHVSSHRFCPSAPWWTHRGDLSAGPAGRDSEVRMNWVTEKGTCIASEVLGVNGGFS